MKITQDVRDYAAKQGVQNLDGVLEKGMEEMSKEFKEKGGEIYNKLQVISQQGKIFPQEYID